MQRVLFLIFLLLFLAACGGDDDGDDNNDSGQNNQNAEQANVPTVNVPTPSISPADLPAGTFTVHLQSATSEQIIEESKLGKDNRNQSEHVLTLVDTFSGFGVTFYLPFDIQPGTYNLALYNPTHTPGRVSATVTTKAAGVYYAQGGILNVESVENGAISGNFSFLAAAQSGQRTYNAHGAFNAIALKQE